MDIINRLIMITDIFEIIVIYLELHEFIDLSNTMIDREYILSLYGKIKFFWGSFNVKYGNNMMKFIKAKKINITKALYINASCMQFLTTSMYFNKLKYLCVCNYTCDIGDWILDYENLLIIKIHEQNSGQEYKYIQYDEEDNDNNIELIKNKEKIIKNLYLILKQKKLRCLTINCQLYDDSQFSNVTDLLLSNNKVITLENCFSLFNLYRLFIKAENIILTNIKRYKVINANYFGIELHINYRRNNYFIKNKKIIIHTTNYEDFINNGEIFINILNNGGYFPPPYPIYEWELCLPIWRIHNIHYWPLHLLINN